MAIFGRPFDELGGVFIDWKANRQRAMTRRNTIGLQIISAADGSRKTLATPAGTRVTNARWTPDSTAIIYVTLGDDGTYLWITDLATNKPRQIIEDVAADHVRDELRLHQGRQDRSWRCSRRMAARRARCRRRCPRVRKSSISMDADRNRLRTFPSLMSTPYDHQLLEWHATGQIGIVDVATGAITKFGKPAMITAMDVSPDGKYARVTQMTKPFSFIVPASSFGSIEEVWDATGKALAEDQQAESESRRAGARPSRIRRGRSEESRRRPRRRRLAAAAAVARARPNNGKRELMWRADGQGFNYLQLEPPPPAANNAGRQGRGGNAARRSGAGCGRRRRPRPRRQAADRTRSSRGRPRRERAGEQPPRKDRLMQWMPPFSETSTKLIYENPTRINGVRFSPDGQIMFFTESNATIAMYVSDMATKYTWRAVAAAVLAGGRAAAAVAAAGGRGGGGGDEPAGSMMTSTGTVSAKSFGGGTPVMISPDGTSVYFQGAGGGGRGGGGGGRQRAAAQAVHRQGRHQDRREDPPVRGREHGHHGDHLDGDRSRDEEAGAQPAERDHTAAAVPVRQRHAQAADEQRGPVPGSHAHGRAALRRDARRRLHVPHDGVPAVRLQGRHAAAGVLLVLPVRVHVAGAVQRRQRRRARAATPQTFPNFGSLSKQFLVRLGYAVVENDSPIVGAAGEMNNNYVNDLRNNLAATIDELDKRMLVDRHRLAIGGHSYGAFSTVNAMVNTPFFKAGIAGDGAYNRTLTPLGFQSERRDLWQAPNVYLDMSPFLRANQLSGALLMYHGMHDQNVGTDPVNSIRLFHALNGLGKTVALYNYPFEDHGPASRETLLDLWSRWAAWLDKYVKNPRAAQQARAGRGAQPRRWRGTVTLT